MGSTETDAEDFDPQGRRLCADGACIGVIGPDGVCKVCGRADDGRPQSGVGDSFAAAAPDQEDEPEVADAPAEDGLGFDPARRLCVEGSCIGVIGADGRCGVCGRTAEA